MNVRRAGLHASADVGKLLRGAAGAVVFVVAPDMAVFAEVDDALALGAVDWLEGRRVFQLLEVVFVRAVPDVHLRLNGGTAFLAVLPAALVTLSEMIAAERVAPMVAVAAISGVGEELVFVLVVADPLAAALGASELAGLATESAAGRLGVISALGLRAAGRNGIAVRLESLAYGLHVEVPHFEGVLLDEFVGRGLYRQLQERAIRRRPENQPARNGDPP